MNSTCARLSLSVACLAFWLPLSAAGAPARNGNDVPKSEPPAEKIRKALDQNISIELTDQRLDQALTQVRDQTKINFLIDRMTLQQLGITAEDATVSVKVENGKVRSALRMMLSQYNLGYAIIGDSVVITTEELALFRQVRQRINVNMDQVPLTVALKQLARETATNLVLDGKLAKEAQQPVTLTVEDVPLEVAVRLLAETCGLKPVRLGNVLFVTTKANAVELRADPDGSTPPTPNGSNNNEDGPARPFPPRPVVAAPLIPPAPAAVPAAKPAEKSKY
jgi:hypothetical protein